MQKISYGQLENSALISESSKATVYSGNWFRTLVAIKRFKVLNNQEFFNEAKLMGQCQFPGIVKFYGACIDIKYPAFVLEYMEQGTLANLLHNQDIKLEWPQRINIALDINAALTYLHSQSIVHRDLNSSNVLLSANYQAKISHFGLAVNLPSPVLNKKLDSNPWRAPESLIESTVISPTEDIYSFGVILWEIATRTIPLEDQQKNIPEGLEQYGVLIPQCLSLPEQRPSALEIINKLEKIKPLSLPVPPKRVIEISTQEERIWHYDHYPQQEKPSKGECTLIPASRKDKDKVKTYYERCPVEGLEIGEVEIIYHPEMKKAFESYSSIQNEKSANPKYNSTWPSKDNTGLRKTVDKRCDSMACYDPKYPGLKFMPAWHGTSEIGFKRICKENFGNFGTTDKGFFGSGLYFTTDAEYAYRVYAQKGAGTLIFVWLIIRSAYPVIAGDNLEGQAIIRPHDAHFVPVVPIHERIPKGINYVAASADKTPMYYEIVMAESSACLPWARVTLHAMLLKTPAALPISRSRKMLLRQDTAAAHRQLQGASSQKRAIARYDYVATQKGQLSFKQGDEFELITQSFDWWFAKKNEETGFIPINFLIIKKSNLELKIIFQKLADEKTSIFDRMNECVKNLGNGGVDNVTPVLVELCQDFFNKIDYRDLPIEHTQRILKKIVTHFSFIKILTIRNCTELNNTRLGVIARGLVDLQKLVLINCKYIDGDGLRIALSHQPDLKIILDEFSEIPALILFNIIKNCDDTLSFMILDKEYQVKTQINELFEIVLKRNDYTNLLTALLMHGAHFSYQQGAQPPLHLAIEHGLFLVQELIRFRTPMNNQNQQGNFVLDVAYEKYIKEEKNRLNYHMILFLLLTHGAFECNTNPALILQTFIAINGFGKNISEKERNAILAFARKNNVLTSEWVPQLIDANLSILDLSSHGIPGHYRFTLTLDIMQAIRRQVPGLKHLIITNCLGFDKRLLNEILSWKLESIEMNFEQALNSGIVTLAQLDQLAVYFYQGVLVKITELNLTGTKVDNAYIKILPQKLAIFLAQTKYLKKLELCKRHFSLGDIRTLVNGFKQNTSLEILLFNSNPTECNLVLMPKNFKENQVEEGNVYVGRKGNYVSCFDGKLGSGSFLKGEFSDPNIDFSELEQNLLKVDFQKKLLSIALKQGQIPSTDAGVILLLEALQTHPSLRELGLERSGVTVKGAEVFGKMLSIHDTLAVFSLQGNPLTDGGVLHLANNLFHRLSLKLGILQSVTLNEVGMTAKSAVTLSNALSCQHEKLHTLDIAYNELGNKSANAFFDLLVRNMQVTNFKYDNIATDPEQMNKIKKQLEINQQLCQKSDLAQCDVDMHLFDTERLSKILAPNKSVNKSNSQTMSAVGMFPLPQGARGQARPLGQFQRESSGRGQNLGRGAFFPRGGPAPIIPPATAQQPPPPVRPSSTPIFDRELS